MTNETRVTDWQLCKDGPWYPELPHGGFVAYRIWQELDGRRWSQRHEWKRANGTTELEQWIDGASGWTLGAHPVARAAA